MKHLPQLKEDTLKYIEKMRGHGIRIVEYKCVECEKPQPTTLPSREGEVWDSVVQCYECGAFYYIIKSFEGVTKISNS